MNNLKYAFFATTAVLLVSGCNHRGANPYDVKTQKNREYADVPLNRHVVNSYDANYYDEVTNIIKDDMGNRQVERIINGSR